MYAGIQYLRGVAATAIVLKHAAHPGGPLQNVLDAGVDLFFAISGFVMVVSTAGRDMTPATFLQKRCVRILPMWWLTLCLVALLGLGEGDLRAWLLSFALIPSGIEYGVGSVYWGVGWSLVLEAVFYILFAIGLAFRTELFIKFALPALVVIGVLTATDSPVLQSWTSPLLTEFLLGVVAARAVLAGFTPPLWLSSIGVCLLVIGGMAAPDYELRAVTLGIPSALIVAGLAAHPPPKLAPLKLLGDASYSIYLLHYVPILLAWNFIPKDSYWPVTAALAVGLGIAGYWFVERPLLNAMRPARKMAAA